MRTILTIFFISLLTFSCQKEKATDAIYKTDSCTTNSKHCYELYIPPKQKNEKLPLLVVIDSHGSGAFAIKNFFQLADRYSVIVVASNLVKNNFPEYQKAIKELVLDVRGKYPVNKQLYLSGFSGGARMVLNYALSNRVNGLVLCGALGNAKMLTSTHCPVVSITGMADFNFIETAQFIINPELAPENLKIELTNDTHRWADSTLLASTFGMVYFSTGQSNKNKIENYCLVQQSRIDSLKQQNDYLRANIIAGNMASDKQLDPNNSFKKEKLRLTKSTGYKNQLKKLKESISFEVKAHKAYNHALLEKDLDWWKNELTSLNAKINSEKNIFTREMYLRIKNFWGIACYSISQRAIQQHDEKALAHILPIYYMLEPENKDMLHFSSILKNWEK